jgi:hypothetical protein
MTEAAICECLENGCLTGGGQYDIPALDSDEAWPTCQECGEPVYVIAGNYPAECES